MQHSISFLPSESSNEPLPGDLFATPDPIPIPPPAPPVLVLPCFVCEAHGMHIVVSEHTGTPLVVCASCRADAHTSLTRLELRIVDHEEQLAQIGAVFDQVLGSTDPIDQQRYDRMRDAISASIGDDALWERVKAAREKARIKGDGLSAILAAEAQCHAVATESGAALAAINEVFSTLHRLKEARGWEVPPEATERRKQMGQPYPLGTPQRTELVGARP